MLIRLKLILVIYKCMFYVNYSKFIVALFTALRFGRLTLYILIMYAYVGTKLYVELGTFHTQHTHE